MGVAHGDGFILPGGYNRFFLAFDRRGPRKESSLWREWPTPWILEGAEERPLQARLPVPYHRGFVKELTVAARSG